FNQIFKVFRALSRAAKTIRHAEIDRAVGERVENRRHTLVQLEYPSPTATHDVCVLQGHAQAIDVESDSGKIFASSDQHYYLGQDIAAVVLEIRIAGPCLGAAGAGSGNIESEGGDVIHALTNFRPLD